jgi:putative ABC transport system permease protein
MLFWTIFKVSIKSLIANKLRSFLAMLGIIIGVAAVISMLALGTGAQQQIMDRFTAMGTNLLVVRPGGQRRGGVRSGSRQTLKLEDAAAIVEKIAGVDAVAPLVQGRAQVKYFNENVNTSLIGASGTYLPIRNFTVGKGRSFSEVEEERSARVALLGSATAETLFHDQNPVGEVIHVGAVSFHVIGVLKSKGDQGWFNPDDMVIIPYTTAMKRILGQDYLGEIDVQAAAGQDMTKMAEEVASLLRVRHRLRQADEDDFNVRNQAEMLEMVSSNTQTFTILLAGIASISLVVGGIGIMNIMLVTVTERTREIGVRKAIGARDRDILGQFLLEAVLVSALGGLLGIGLGYGVTRLVERFTEYIPIVQAYAVFLSIAVSCSVGVVFGFLPARRAARLDPIVALRYE